MSSLQGKIIITTCANDKAEKIKGLTSLLGANTYNFPLIDINEAVENQSNIEASFGDLDSYNWIVFTSSNGVLYYHHWAKKLNIPIKKLAAKYAVIGKATANALRNIGIEADYISAAKDSENFAKELLELIENPNQKLLIPTGNLAANHINETLDSKHFCNKLIVYKTIQNSKKADSLHQWISENNCDMMLFLSPSAVDAFFSKTENKEAPGNTKYACIGTTTSGAFAKYGIKPSLISSVPNIENMITEIDNYYKIND